MKSLSAGLIALLFVSCSPSVKKAQLPTGVWRATLSYKEAELPFNFQLIRDTSGAYMATIINAGERLVLDEVNIKGDSVMIPLHIFDATIKTVFNGDSLKGIFLKHYDPTNAVPFTAVYGQAFRFRRRDDNRVASDFSGKYRVLFTNEKDTTQAIGLFEQKADSVTGTFLTATGDYRYLQGNVVNDTMKVSAFDGNHAYLFVSVFEADGVMRGTFYSSPTRKTQWTAWRDDNAQLPDADTLTRMNTGYEKIEFTFPDVNGNMVSLADEKYRNKVVILQLFGTWCPNCMDETRFLAPWYVTNKPRGVEIIGLAFERKDDFTYASTRVKRMQEKMNVPYEMVIAGTNDKKQASSRLPMLSEIKSFPTTIFIGKDGRVRKIHTGFSGPGTGKYYDEFVHDFNNTVDQLLKEKDITGI